MAKLIVIVAVCALLVYPAFAQTKCAPAKAGYTLKADTNWKKLAGSTEAKVTPAEAEKMCNSNAGCLAWNNFGYYILASGGPSALSFSPYVGLCVYVKSAPAGESGLPCGSIRI
jgi:hypothetical protein